MEQVQILEKGKISSFQLGLLIFTTIISTSDVFLPSLVAKYSGRDSWVSVIIATVVSMALAYIFITLAKKYPNKTPTIYLREIFGKGFGTLIALLIWLYFMFIAWYVVRELAQIFTVSFIPEAPIAIYIIISTLLASYGVYLGLEVITRTNEILLPIGVFALLISSIISIPNINLKYFLPIMDIDIPSILRGSSLIFAWFCEGFIILQLYPFVSDKKNVPKALYLCFFFIGIGMLFGMLTYAVFGPLTPKLMFPVLEFIRYGSISKYLQNFEVLTMIIWMSGIFVKILIFFYVSALSFAEIFNLKSYRFVIIPLCFTIISLSHHSISRIIEVGKFLSTIFPLYDTVMTVILPILILLSGFVKQKIKALKNIS